MADSDVVRELKAANKFLEKISGQLAELNDHLEMAALGIFPPAKPKAKQPRKSAPIPGHLKKR